MRVHASQSAKTVCGHARSFQIRQLYPSRVAYDHIFNVTLAINERAYLPARFKREFRHLSSELRRHYLVGSDAPRVEFFYAAQLTWL